MSAPGLTPPQPRVGRCACGEPLTLECEFDREQCVDCQAEASDYREVEVHHGR